MNLVKKIRIEYNGVPRDKAINGYCVVDGKYVQLFGNTYRLLYGRAFVEVSTAPFEGARRLIRRKGDASGDCMFTRFVPENNKNNSFYYSVCSYYFEKIAGINPNGCKEIWIKLGRKSRSKFVISENNY